MIQVPSRGCCWWTVRPTATKLIASFGRRVLGRLWPSLASLPATSRPPAAPPATALLPPDPSTQGCFHRLTGYGSTFATSRWLSHRFCRPGPHSGAAEWSDLRSTYAACAKCLAALPGCALLLQLSKEWKPTLLSPQVATDLSLRCLENTLVVPHRSAAAHVPTAEGAAEGAGRPVEETEVKLAGLGFAMCCHHLCQWADYVAKPYFTGCLGLGVLPAAPTRFALPLQAFVFPRPPGNVSRRCS